jgi:hypothetical protein
MEKLQAGEQAAIPLAESMKVAVILCSTKRQHAVLRPVVACESLASLVFWVRLRLGDWLNWRPRLGA